MKFRITKAKEFDAAQPRDSRGRWTNGINWDARGHGGTPTQVDISYFGFVKQMTPAEFRALVPKGNWNTDTIQFIKDAVAKGEAVAPPFLLVKWDADNKQWLVQDHEGRSRTDAAQEIAPDQNIPIHIIPQGLRARHMTDEMLNAPFVPQSSGKAKYEDDDTRTTPPIRRIPLAGRKYNPDWYLQPRRRGKWDTVALKREEKGHLDSWGTGETEVNLDMSNTDKKYAKMGFGMEAENLASFLHGTFASTLPAGSRLEMMSSYYPSLTDNAMVTMVRLECKTPKLLNTLRVYHYLDNSPPKFEVSYLELPYNDQAQGVGKTALKSFMDLADHIGADRISLLANIDVGGYAWARYGFVPTPTAWKNLCAAVRKNMALVDFGGDTSLATKLNGHIKTLTAPGSDPRNVRAIAALKAPVEFPKLGKTGLGWALLRMTGWESEAHMNDKEVMAHLKATCAKEESFDEDDWQRIADLTTPMVSTKAPANERGAFFMSSPTGRSDAAIHKAMLPAGSFVADQVAIRQLMTIGLSRAEARRFVSSQRGYGG